LQSKRKGLPPLAAKKRNKKTKDSQGRLGAGGGLTVLSIVSKTYGT